MPAPARAAILLVALVLSSSLATVPASAEDEPTDRAFVIVSVFPETPRTWEILTVTVRSKVWEVDLYGNVTLVPNPGYVNVSLYDRAHDVRIAGKDAPFRNGTATAEFLVKPEWSDLWVEARAEDPVTRLAGALRFRTEYSMSYVLWKMENDWLASYNEFAAQTAARYAAERNFERAMTLLAVLGIVTTIATVFLRREHRKSRAHALSSMWDRFAEKFPFSLVPCDLWIALDIHRAPPAYLDLANEWAKRRREAIAGAIDEEKAFLDKAREHALRGLLDA